MNEYDSNCRNTFTLPVYRRCLCRSSTHLQHTLTVNVSTLHSVKQRKKNIIKNGKKVMRMNAHLVDDSKEFSICFALVLVILSHDRFFFSHYFDYGNVNTYR